MAEQRYACPKCGSTDGLWRGVDVPGWQSIGADLKPVGGSSDREALWSEARADGEYGCGECQWQGWQRDLTKIGIDDKPLIEVPAEQGELGLDG